MFRGTLARLGVIRFETMSDPPDFAVLYARSPQAPRTAARMWVVALLAYDEFRQGVPDMWIEQLPPVATPYIDEQFVAAFGSRFDMLAMRLAGRLDNPTDLTTCTADGAVLHMVIDFLEDTRANGLPGQEWIETLPHRPRDDDYRWTKELVLYDVDVLHLYNPAMDGAEDPESGIAQAARFVNLHPRDWFKPFAKQQGGLPSAVPRHRELLRNHAHTGLVVRVPSACERAGSACPSGIHGPVHVSWSGPAGVRDGRHRDRSIPPRPELGPSAAESEAASAQRNVGHGIDH